MKNGHPNFGVRLFYALLLSLPLSAPAAFILFLAKGDSAVKASLHTAAVLVVVAVMFAIGTGIKTD